MLAVAMCWMMFGLGMFVGSWCIPRSGRQRLVLGAVILLVMAATLVPYMLAEPPTVYRVRVTPMEQK